MHAHGQIISTVYPCCLLDRRLAGFTHHHHEFICTRSGAIFISNGVAQGLLLFTSCICPLLCSLLGRVWYPIQTAQASGVLKHIMPFGSLNGCQSLAVLMQNASPMLDIMGLAHLFNISIKLYGPYMCINGFYTIWEFN